MLKKSTSGVLASLRGSTLRGTSRIFEILNGLIRSPRLIARANGYTKCGPYLLASSLAAAWPTDFLSILLDVSYYPNMCGPLNFQRAARVFPHPFKGLGKRATIAGG
jgi:hypothetical protein